MADIRNDTYYLITLIRNANSIFLWGFMYYSVFLYLIRNRHYKVPNQKQAERKMTYISSWMLLLWVTKVSTIEYTTFTSTIGMTMGNVIFQNCSQAFAPSMCAASYRCAPMRMPRRA